MGHHALARCQPEHGSLTNWHHWESQRSACDVFVCRPAISTHVISVGEFTWPRCSPCHKRAVNRDIGVHLRFLLKHSTQIPVRNLLHVNAIAIKAQCMLLRFPQAISEVFVLTLYCLIGNVHRAPPPMYVLHREGGSHVLPDCAAIRAAALELSCSICCMCLYYDFDPPAQIQDIGPQRWGGVQCLHDPDGISMPERWCCFVYFIELNV